MIYLERMENVVSLDRNERQTNVQISAEPVTEAGPLWLEGKNLTNCVNV